MINHNNKNLKKSKKQQLKFIKIKKQNLDK